MTRNGVSEDRRVVNEQGYKTVRGRSSSTRMSLLLNPQEEEDQGEERLNALPEDGSRSSPLRIEYIEKKYIWNDTHWTVDRIFPAKLERVHPSGH